MTKPAAFIWMGLLATVFVIACNKEEDAAPVEPAPEPVAKEFEACPCSVTAPKSGEEEYIKAEIDGVSVCFDVLPNMTDNFAHMLKWGYILRDTGKQYYDNVHMIRNAANSRWQAAIFLENTHALTKTYPYELPRANPEVCEIGELQLNDRNNYVSCTFCPENKYNYYAQFWGSGVKMKVLGFNDNIFEGTFSGSVRTGSGKSVSIRNGRFRIRLAVSRQDIAVN